MFKKLFTSNSKKVSIQVANAVSCVIDMQRNIFNQTLGKFFGGLRDIYTSLGYNKTLKIENYVNYYYRHAIAKTVVKAYPNACWSISPQIIDNEDQEETQFEKDVKILINKHQMFKYMKRADRLAGVLTYSVIMIGFKDNLTTDQPATGGEVAYFQAFREDDAQIDKYNNDPTSERFGKPELYSIRINNDNSSTTIKVHWSRIIHIAEECDIGDIHGTPRMEAVWNNLYNIEKISGASAEGYWRNGTSGSVAEYDKEATIDEEQAKAFKAQMSKWVDGFEKSLIVKGAQVKALNINMNDPSPHFMMEIQQISAEKRIPQRILLGSEQGNLASSQDTNRWLDDVASRQVDFCEPDILRKTIDRLIELGSISPPSSGEYSIYWHDLKAKDEKAIAETSKIKTEALVKYGDSAATQAIFPPEQYYSLIMQMTKEEIEAIDIDAMEETTEEPEQEDV